MSGFGRQCSAPSPGRAIPLDFGDLPGKPVGGAFNHFFSTAMVSLIEGGVAEVTIKADDGHPARAWPHLDIGVLDG
jgi:hypothetical protein